MSELIVRMEMPRNCYVCELANFTVDKLPYCRKTMKDDGCTEFSRPSWCPIVGVLPEQHGRLVDAYAFAEEIKKVSVQLKYEEFFPDHLSVADILDAVCAELDGRARTSEELCPTIVPATAKRKDDEKN